MQSRCRQPQSARRQRHLRQRRRRQFADRHRVCPGGVRLRPQRRQTGLFPLESIFFSCIIYAGASRFVITALLSAGMSLWVSALTVMAMDVRHLLYGRRCATASSRACRPVKRRCGPGLTDEVFAAATAGLMRNNRSWSENWMLGIALCSRFRVAGTALGALFGNGPLEQFPVIEASLAFMLPALFLSFLLAAFRRPQSLTIAAALAGALLGVVLFSIPVAIWPASAPAASPPCSSPCGGQP
ncbi:AzlC family ABC transporter permease [Serratia marcescens]|uniref:AzlC family ABC transporter permease n=1 Tax=Serratia marcescens TaxID=615 RepID=A0A939SVI3_SERMA|nr:AzlC family ABC transporter permease [Serratia marcescens]